jgi:hypothetical protein
MWLLDWTGAVIVASICYPLGAAILMACLDKRRQLAKLLDKLEREHKLPRDFDGGGM